MDKHKEQEILTMIYSSEAYIISETEEPDFIMEDRITGRNFGVEITEAFYTESDARLINISGYLNKIIEKEQYVHKDDIVRLPVKEVQIQSLGLKENPRDVKCIIRDIPSCDEIGNIVGNIIFKKNDKLGIYRRKVANIHLIIFDNEHFIKRKNELFSSIFNIDLIKAIADTGFEEIYFLTKIKTEMIYYELKSACFIILAFLTLAFTKCFDMDNPDRFHLTLDVLNQLGLKTKTFFSDEEDCIKIKCGNSIICLSEQRENNELVISEVHTSESLQEYSFEDFTCNNSIFNDIEEQYYKFIFSKNIIIDLSHKASNFNN